MSVEGWKLRRLDEIGEICSGSTPSTNNLSYWDGDITWVTPNDLSKLNTPYLITSSKKITQQGLKSCSAQIVPIGSIILSSRAPIGYLAISLVDCCTNQGCKSFNLNPEYDSEFVYYNLKYNINKIKNLGEGTTFAEISKTALSKIQISFLENKQEQTQIATILSTIDRAIEQTEALITKQQRIKTGLMQDLLTKGIDENGNIRSEETHNFKDSPLGRIPVEWDIQRVTSICDEIFLGLTSKVDYVEEQGVPLIRATDISSGQLLFKDALSISRLQHKQLTKYRKPQKGDILVSKSGSLGVCALVDTNKEFSIYESIIVLQPNSEKIDSIFLLWIMRFEQTQKRLLGEKVGSTVGHLNLINFRLLSLTIPKISEQKKIASLLNEYSILLQQEQNYLKKLKQLKTGLMQDLLTGKVRVTDLLNQKTATN
jgi:type I restriction enzyme S subunit